VTANIGDHWSLRWEAHPMPVRHSFGGEIMSFAPPIQ
jgi:hypothetical protein